MAVPPTTAVDLEVLRFFYSLIAQTSDIQDIRLKIWKTAEWNKAKRSLSEDFFIRLKKAFEDWLNDSSSPVPHSSYRTYISTMHGLEGRLWDWEEYLENTRPKATLAIDVIENVLWEISKHKDAHLELTLVGREHHEQKPPASSHSNTPDRYPTNLPAASTDPGTIHLDSFQINPVEGRVMAHEDFFPMPAQRGRRWSIGGSCRRRRRNNRKTGKKKTKINTKKKTKKKHKRKQKRNIK